MSLNNWIRGLVLSDAVIMLLDRMDAKPEEFGRSLGPWGGLLSKDGFTKLEWWVISRKINQQTRKRTQERILKQIIAPEEPKVYMGEASKTVNRFVVNSNSPTPAMLVEESGDVKISGTVYAKNFEWTE